jgi:hypothetical protein
VIIGFQLLLALFLGLSLADPDRAYPVLQVLIRNPIFYTGFGWVLVIFLLLATLGLLFLKRWGWTLTMVLTGMGLFFSIYNYFQGNPNYLAMGLYLVIVFYLNQREVQSPFRRKNPQWSRE